MGKSTAYQRRMARIQILSTSTKVRPHMPATHHWGGANRWVPEAYWLASLAAKEIVVNSMKDMPQKLRWVMVEEAL